MDEDDVLVAVHKIHHRLGGVAEKKKGKMNWSTKKKPKQDTNVTGLRLCYSSKRRTVTSCSKPMKTSTHLLHTCTSVSRANSRSVSSLWCIGDHLNSGMRNMVVRGPGLNCRRCSSVMGIPLKPRSTRRSLSSWAALRPWRACVTQGPRQRTSLLPVKRGTFHVDTIHGNTSAGGASNQQNCSSACG